MDGRPVMILLPRNRHDTVGFGWPLTTHCNMPAAWRRRYWLAGALSNVISSTRDHHKHASLECRWMPTRLRLTENEKLQAIRYQQHFTSVPPVALSLDDDTHMHSVQQISHAGSQLAFTSAMEIIQSFYGSLVWFIVVSRGSSAKVFKKP